MTTGERGPTGDHGQDGQKGQAGSTGATGAQGEQGVGFSKSQTLVLFLFVVAVAVVLGLRTEHNAGRMDVLEHQVQCLQVPAGCSNSQDSVSP